MSQDFIKGIDLTGYTSVSGSELNALVDEAQPATGIGFNFTTLDVAGVPEVPDPSDTGEGKLVNYLWRRVGATTVTLYVWNPAAASDATFLKWQNSQSSSIAPLSITNGMLANASVDDSKVSSISASKISGLASSFPPSGAASGDLTGIYPGPTVAANAITASKLSSSASDDTLRAVGNDHVKNLSLASTGAAGKLSVFGSALQFLRVNAAATALEAVTSYFTQLATLGTAFQIPRVNTGATALEWVSPVFLTGYVNQDAGGIIPANDTFVTFTHGLVTVPIQVRIVARCLSAENGYSIGDEVPVSNILIASATVSPIVVTIDAINIKVVVSSAYTPGTMRIMSKSTPNTLSTITRASWVFKCYAAV